MRKYWKSKELKTVFRADFDSYSNTHCSGAADTNLNVTGIEYEVQVFKCNLGSCKYIQICTTTTAYDKNNSGEKIFLIHV